MLYLDSVPFLRAECIRFLGKIHSTPTSDSFSPLTSEKAKSSKFEPSSEILGRILSKLYSLDEIQMLNNPSSANVSYKNSKLEHTKITKDLTVEQGM